MMKLLPELDAIAWRVARIRFEPHVGCSMEEVRNYFSLRSPGVVPFISLFAPSSRVWLCRCVSCYNASIGNDMHVCI